MKKLLVLPLFFLAAGIIFSQENSKEDSYQIVYLLLKDGLNKNFFQIQKEAENLDTVQRLQLYNTYEGELTTPLVLNILIGFGIGSAVQKDVVGTIAGAAGDATAAILLAAGFVKFFQSIIDENFEFKPDDTAVALFTASGILYGASKIFQIVKPITFKSSYDNKLKEALNSHSVSLVPVFDANSAGIRVSFKY